MPQQRTVDPDWRYFEPDDPPVVEKERRIKLYHQRFLAGQDLYTGEPLTPEDLAEARLLSPDCFKKLR